MKNPLISLEEKLENISITCMGKLFMLSEIQDQGQVDTLQIQHGDQREGPFSSQHAPRGALMNRSRGVAVLLYLTSFFVLKKV